MTDIDDPRIAASRQSHRGGIHRHREDVSFCRDRLSAAVRRIQPDPGLVCADEISMLRCVGLFEREGAGARTALRHGDRHGGRRKLNILSEYEWNSRSRVNQSKQQHEARNISENTCFRNSWWKGVGCRQVGHGWYSLRFFPETESAIACWRTTVVHCNCLGLRLVVCRE